jgi:hypothetical protein
MKRAGSLVGEELHFILYLNNYVSLSHQRIGQEQSVFGITKCFIASLVPYCKEIQTYDGDVLVMVAGGREYIGIMLL